jgi:RNA-directed DNA polymerase
MNVLPIMTPPTPWARKTLQSPVAERHLEAEVAHCVGGVLSPLLANIALSVLDEHFQQQWRGWDAEHRKTRRRQGLGTWRLVRYADDVVVMVDGPQANTQALRGEVAAVLAPLGLRLSQAKTRVVHLQEGFDFLGFHIKWMRKRGTDKWFVYTLIADKPVREFKRKIRALTHRRSQVGLGTALTRINQIQRGWANYFKHAVAKHTFDRLRAFVWWRIINWVRYRHRMTWKALRRRFKGPSGWRPVVVDGSNCSTSPRWASPATAGVEPPSRHPGRLRSSNQRHDPVESRMR